MQAYSRAVRIRALEALDLGTPRAEVIRLFGVSTATLTRWRRRQRETGSLAASPRPGPPGPAAARLQAGRWPHLEERPDATLEEHRGWWEQRGGVRASRATMSRVSTRHCGWSRGTRPGARPRAAWREPIRGVDPARFVGVDATGRDLGLTRPSSRAPRGQRAQATAPARAGRTGRRSPR